MNKTILFFLSMLLLTIISCSRSNDDSSNNNTGSIKLDNTNWSGSTKCNQAESINGSAWCSDKVQIQFLEKNTYKLYGYGKTSQNQWYVNSGPYKGTYTYSSNGAVSLNFESGVTFNTVSTGNISGTILILQNGTIKITLNKE